MIPTGVVRADMHCHSTASQVAKLGIQRSVGLPECATPPEEVYELAKRRGMDFVTITDHDTIDGCLELADRARRLHLRGADRLVRRRAAGGARALLRDHPGGPRVPAGPRPDLETCAEYLHERGITCALAHPFFAVAAPLTARHRRRLAELFPVWETRNGSRARELNMPAAVYIETHGGTGIGGSDDHAGVDIGRTFTETPPASSPEEFLRHVREGRADSRGDQGSAAKWAHSALALATRALLARPSADPGTPAGEAEEVAGHLFPLDRAAGSPSAWSPTAASAAARSTHGLGADEARAVLRAWLDEHRPEHGPARTDRADAGRRLQPLGARPPRAPRPRALASRRGRRGGRRGRER